MARAATPAEAAAAGGFAVVTVPLKSIGAAIHADLVTRLYNEFGFDTVNTGPLSESWRVERDRPAYVVRQNAAELEDNLARAPRTI